MRLRFSSIVALVWLIPAPLVLGGYGDPIAIRQIDDGHVRIESYWGLQLSIHRSLDASAPVTDASKSVSLREDLDHVFTRPVNQDSAAWLSRGRSTEDDANEIQVVSVAEAALHIRVDGVSILVCDATMEQLPDNVPKAFDALIAWVSADNTKPPTTLRNLMEDLQPRYVIPMGLAANTEWSDATSTHHSVLAISASKTRNPAPRIVLLESREWPMDSEMERLFIAMEQACRDSQEVFRDLSIDQMNFRPSNGTHTPRWNAEHMMGRQLQFFSQIYHEIDPEIPVLNLNPKQMPDAYRFAHPDWSGAEEARQMQRVSDFTRRFSYLLDGLPLDRRAPGSRWPSLRALLRQMERHYQEHTANTEAKFALPDWPRS